MPSAALANFISSKKGFGKSNDRAGETCTARNPAAPTADELKKWLQAIAADSDREAFISLFKFFAPRLLSFLMRPGLARSAAEDVMQETMISVWRKAALYDAQHAEVATWIFTIARNLRIDRLRHDERAADHIKNSFEEEDVSSSAEEALLAEERDARVRSALNGLTQEQAAVLRLSFFAEKPHAEIAQELGIPLGTVKSRVRLAMARLRVLLEDQA